MTAGLALLLCLPAQGDEAPVFKPIEIAIAHINDHHSNLVPIRDFEIRVNGVPTRVELGGMARIAALFRQLGAQPNLLRLHAGDAITGTLFHTLFKGEADAAVMNDICFDAYSLGNHAFDDGDAGLARFLDYLGQGECDTRLVTANVEPLPGTPLAPRQADDYLKPPLIRQMDGVPVAVVGIVVRGKTLDSSRPLPSTRIHDEAATAQAVIDRLRQAGVRHIVLLTHQGYQADKDLAAHLTDVDVIIGGDSHTLLGEFDTLGLSAAGPYPTLARNRNGDPVCIGQAWEYGKALGLLRVSFDARGVVSSCAGEVILPIGDDFRQANEQGQFVAVDEARRKTLLTQLAQLNGIRSVAPDPRTAATISRFAARMDDLARQVIGRVDEPLCLVRVPGEAGNRSGGLPGCEMANRLARGSDAAQVVAQAFLRASKRADFALQNAGGVRTPLAAGDLSLEAANRVLPFANVLMELPVSGAQLLASLEEGVANHLDHGGSNGSHPYMAGVRWDLDLSAAKGRRFSNVEVRDKIHGAWSPLDPARTYTLVTNDYLASGKEGYKTLGDIYLDGNAINTYLPYTQTFIDYLRDKGHLSRPEAGEYSHQRVVTQDGKRLAGP